MYLHEGFYLIKESFWLLVGGSLPMSNVTMVVTGIGGPGVKAAGRWESPDVGAEKRLRVFRKRRTLF